MANWGFWEAPDKPHLSETDRKALQDFWGIYEANYERVWQQVSAPEKKHKFDQALLDYAAKSREARRRAIVLDDWQPFLAELRALGASYAQAGTQFSDWLQMLARWRAALIPLLQEAYGQTPDRFVSVIHGLDKFGEMLQAVVGQEFLETQQRIIGAQQETLRASEEKLAGIIASAMDAIISVDAQQRITVFNKAAEQMFRCPAGEAIGQTLDRFIPPRLREAHRKHVNEFGKTGVTSRTMASPGVLNAVRADGEQFLIEAAISQVEAAGEKLYTVILRDVTDRWRAEQRLVTQQAVTRILAEATSVSGAASGILKAICESLCWEVGALWTVDWNEQVLRCADIWHLPGHEAPEFERISRERAFSRGEGLPGRVWATGKPVWIADVLKDTNFPRAPIAAKEGLHAAFGFPIVLGTEVLGVMEFFSRAIQEPDDHLLRMMATVGSQIGQFMERRRAEEEVLKQQEAIRELSTPVLQLRERLLILPMIGVIDSLRARQMTDQLLRAIRAQRARAVVIDITGVAAMDAAIANHLVATVQAARLLGARVILSGLSTAIAATLVNLGVDLSTMTTVGDLQSGIEEGNRLLGYEVVPIQEAETRKRLSIVARQKPEAEKQSRDTMKAAGGKQEAAGSKQKAEDGRPPTSDEQTA